MTTTRRFLLATLVLATMVSMTACDRGATTAPDGPEIRTTVPAEWPPEEASAAAGHKTAGGEFYPLALGNRWHYALTDRMWAVVGGVPQPADVYTGTVSEELTEIETLLDRDYMVAERHIQIPGSLPDVYEWIRYRQDKAGLYEADASVGSPPGSPEWASLFAPLPTAPPPPAALVASAGEKQAAEIWPELWARSRAARAAARGANILAASPPGGALSQELVRLVYPLHPGASWVIREDPLFTTTVEKREVLELAGQRLSVWRTRTEFPLMGPNDVVHVWYGRMGRAGFAYHLESVYTDPGGNQTGVFVFESEEMLDGFELARPGGGPVAASSRGTETADGL